MYKRASRLEQDRLRRPVNYASASPRPSPSGQTTGGGVGEEVATGIVLLLLAGLAWVAWKTIQGLVWAVKKLSGAVVAIVSRLTGRPGTDQQSRIG